ncbi:Crp/Fnr family transcriptional regulator [Bosea sp. Leaf344]|uniref:Crp/Fnr family transcriptional regulator n=1 Tax=Bosea sp. Leaf344 TaxID=1736346 RepID=UPI0006FC4179|nr:Crp/Fnr family transcriptional regulator [Bosea sp. Leaf344]
MLRNYETVHAMERLPRRSFEKGAVIRQPDDLSETVLLIESGRAQCFYMTPQGSDAVLGELGAGDFIGDLQALDGGIPDACYEALERTSAILFRRDEFLERLRLSAPFAEAYTRRLCTRVRLLNQLYVESRVLPMRERLFAELIRLSLRTETGRIVIAPAPTHAELARRIASQRETVTKQMSALARSGIISLEGQTIIIEKPGDLQAALRDHLGDMAACPPDSPAPERELRHRPRAAAMAR